MSLPFEQGKALDVLNRIHQVVHWIAASDPARGAVLADVGRLLSGTEPLTRRDVADLEHAVCRLRPGPLATLLRRRVMDLHELHGWLPEAPLGVHAR